MIQVKSFLAELRLFTKACAAGIVGFVGLMQLDAVKNFVTPIVAAHPKAASFVAGVMGFGMLLSNPQVRKTLHLDDTEAEQK